MKRILTIMICCLISAASWGQHVPQGIHYQAVLRSDVGVPLGDRELDVRVAITDPQTEHIYYEESHQVMVAPEGTFGLVIGQGHRRAGNFRTIPWSVGNLWADIRYDLDGKGQYVSSGGLQLLSVPYAFYAQSAGVLEEGLEEGAVTRGSELVERFWQTDGNDLLPPDSQPFHPDSIIQDQDIIPQYLGLRTMKPLLIRTSDSLRMFIMPNGDLYVLKDQYNYGDLDVRGNGRFWGDFIIKGQLTADNGEFDDLHVLHDAHIDHDLWVKNDTRIEGDLDVFGIARFNNTTQSTTKDNGAVIIEGGVGIEKNVNIGGNTDIDGTLCVDGVTTLKNTTESTTKDNGALVVEGGVGIEKNTNVGGNTELDGTLGVDGITTLKNTTQSTNKDNGAMVVEGGVGIEKNLYVGGKVGIDSDLELGGKLFIGDETQSTMPDNGALVVAGGTGIGKNLNVGGNTELDGSLGVDGNANFRNRTTFDINVTGDQLLQTSYPVLIKGSKQGLAIDLTPAENNPLKSHRGNNYISFWRNGEQKGRIEGMGTADLDPTGLVSLFVGMINSPNFGTTYDPFSQGLPNSISDLMSFSPGGLPSFTGALGLTSVFSTGSLPSASFNFTDGLSFSPGSLPGISNIGSSTLNSIFSSGSLPGLNFLSIQDFVDFSNPFSNPGSYSQFTGFIQNFNGQKPASPAHIVWNTIKSSLMSSGMYPADPTNFESQIFSNYTLDIIQQGISTLKAAITFVSSVASVADPEDIFSQGVDLVVEITSITIYGAYADLNLGVAYESGAGDYAEWLLRANPSEYISQGDVVGVIGGKVSKAFDQADKFMVVSTSPLLLGNMPANGKEEQLSEKIAFMGQVPVKVQGPVKIGDYILPSGDGNGLGIAVDPDDMKARDYQRIVGVAWQDGSPDQFINLINTAVGVNHNDMARQMEQVQMTLNHIQETLVKLDPSYQMQKYDVGSKPFIAKPLDYTVSNTNLNHVSDYFKGSEFASRDEMMENVKIALNDKANININNVPIMKFVFEHPELASSVAAQFQDILQDMVAVQDEVAAKVAN